jgi:succinate dehydrogenase / fumarate reductase cytochrome b subunit
MTDAITKSEPDAVAPSTPRWRRWHTLSGGLVLAAFLVEHLLTNASALGGAASFDAVVGSILRLRVLPLFEVVFILVPLGFHAGAGIHLLRSGSADDAMERYGDRRLWIVQRISAVFVFLFVLGHLWELRIQRLFFGLAPSGVYTTLTAHLSWTWAGVPWIALGYLLGIFATAFHLANGLFAATAAWKLAVDPRGRRRMRVLTVALGIVLSVIGAATVIGLATGTRLLPGADDDSGPPAPCGSSAAPTPPPFKLPAASPSH